MTTRGRRRTIEDNRTRLRHAFGQLGCSSTSVNNAPNETAVKWINE